MKCYNCGCYIVEGSGSIDSDIAICDECLERKNNDYDKGELN